MDLKKIKKISIIAGGTGGHVFPSLSLADYLKKDYKVQLISDKRGKKYLKHNHDFEVKIISSSTIFTKNLLKVLISLIRIFFSFLVSMFDFIISRPKMVIGMGGYLSFPVCLAAFFLRIPIIIYENNLIIGRTNKFLSPFVKKILVSTSDVKGIPKKFNYKVFTCGYLLRNDIFEISRQEFKSNNSELSILITGGSQSAKIFGEKIPNIIKKCSENKIRFTIFQQCMKEQTEDIKKIYENLKLNFELFNFSENLFEYYKKADLVITRSGASSLAELVNLKIPFIAIPLPSSVDNHQFQNALYFKNKKYCFLLEEKYISEKLYNILKDLNADRNQLIKFQQKMNNHSDGDTLTKIKKLITKTLNEPN